MEWFLGCLGRAIDGAQETLGTVLDKARFWDRIKDVQIKGRQRLVINRLLDGFEGKLTSSKYAVPKGAGARVTHSPSSDKPREGAAPDCLPLLPYLAPL
jgi:hypothetical protein